MTFQQPPAADDEDAPPTMSLRRPVVAAPAGPGVLAVSRTDPVARVASQVIGGPAGSRLATGGHPLRVVLVLVLLAMATLGLGVVDRQHCRATGWTTPDQFWHACYSDIPVLYGSVGLGGQDRPTLQQAVSVGSLGPPLEAAAMWAVSGLVQDSGAKAAPRRFFDLSAVVLAGALGATVALVAAAGGRRRWDAAQVALAPIVVTAGLLSYELLGTALMTAALVAWARRHPLLAGVLLGLAAGVRPLSAAVGLCVFTVTLRAGKLRPFATLAGAGALTWLGLRLVLFQGYGLGLAQGWQSWKSTVPGYGSVWLVPQLLAQAKPTGADWWFSGPTIGATAATTGSLIAMFSVLMVTVTLGMVTQDRPRLAHLALFAVAGCLVVSKAVPVQASLILVPLVALAGLRWRDHLLWATAEIAYFVGTWLYIAGASKPDRGLPAGFYLILLLLRLAAIAWLAVQGLRRSLDSARDPVRLPEDGAPGRDDPLGGPVEEAPDSLVVQLS
ncbi:MAG TPA: hypothetical protein VFP72_17370 [Kineosporiaceae bacterium]|nr:hypothetical protein [Kineosporiaceae bacterium]